jgi:adenylate cyclase
MIAAVEALNEELLRGDEPLPARFSVGVGINTGDCVVGNIGSRWRYDYSVIGDAVNLASRLEGLSKDYGAPIILGPGTADMVRTDFVLIELDRIAVRGRAAATAIYTVLGGAERGSEAAVRSLLAGHPSFLDALRSGDAAGAHRRAAELSALMPELAVTYRLLLARHAAAMRAERSAQG